MNGSYTISFGRQNRRIKTQGAGVCNKHDMIPRAEMLLSLFQSPELVFVDRYPKSAKRLFSVIIKRLNSTNKLSS